MPEPTVLIIDDEPAMLRLCEKLMSRGGFRVLTATTEDRAAELLREENVNLLLIELLIPGGVSLRVIQNARQLHPDLAVLVMSGTGEIEKALSSMGQGAGGLILKPFADPDELPRVAKKAIRDSRAHLDAARMQALRPLFDISEVLLSETNPDLLADLILNTIKNTLHSPTQAIYRRDESDKMLFCVAGSGRPLADEVSQRDGGPVGRADALGVPLRVIASYDGDDWLAAPLRRNGLEFVLCVPVAQKETRFVFMAGRPADASPYSDLEREMFIILARQAAVALENARYYSEMTEHIRRVEEAQRGLVQTEKMAAVGRLMASVAHEVNNPLQSIKNCLHLAGRDDLPEESRKNYLGLAAEELERLADIIRGMLDFYRQGLLNQAPVDINMLINRVLGLLSGQLKEQNIQVETSLQENLPDVEAVSDQMQQVFFNLILNAMDAVKGNGKISITSKGEAGQVVVTIEDNGPGIPEALRKQVFEPFVSTKPAGTGLGLTVSYTIMEAHGGSLQLVPTAEGACFRLTIPTKD